MICIITYDRLVTVNVFFLGEVNTHMSDAKKQVTIVEIARMANTSTATVSRVLSGTNYPVSPRLRTAVEKAAAEMNYVPNAIGQTLKFGKSNDIGVIIPNFTNPFYMQLISGIETICRQREYNPIFCSSNNSEAQEAANIELLRRKCVDGLIISSISQNPQNITESLKLHKNIVLFDQETTFDNCDYVSFDFEQGGILITNYLLEMGHRHIAFLTAPLEKRASRKSLYLGFQQAMANFAEATKEVLVSCDVQIDDYKIWEYENGRELARCFAKLSPRPTAIFVYNDATAISVMSQLNVLGIKVPEDVSVVGFDNILMSEYSNPPLTTVLQPAFETGAMATKIILDKIEGKNKANCQI